MDDVQQELRAAERAAAAPFVDEPRSESWYPLFMAAFCTAIVAGPLLVVRGPGALGLGVQLVAVLALGAYYARHHSRAGAVPRMRSAPPEVRRAYSQLFVGIATAALLSAGLWVLGGWRVGLSTVFVSSLVVVWLYERRLYPRAVARVRGRLA